MTEKIVYGDGIHDDTEALQAYFNGERVIFYRDVSRINSGSGVYAITNTLSLDNSLLCNGEKEKRK